MIQFLQSLTEKVIGMSWFSWSGFPLGKLGCSLLLVIVVALGTSPDSSADQHERPNIVWIVVDDMSANFSCYGETAIETPAVDQLAADGVRFTRAYATAPVCSSFRSAMITGMYQTTIGSHHHRSGRGQHRIQLPSDVHPVPAYFQEAGYWTCIGSGLPMIDHQGLEAQRVRRGKTDYNFDWDEAIYDSHDWAGRGENQPFFMQVQTHGGKMRGASLAANEALSARAAKEFGQATQVDDVTLPPYYPRDPVLLGDWASYLDTVRLTDQHTGRVIDRLRDEGLWENTLVVFFTDHGISHARGKQFLYDEGIHIPLVIRGPGLAANTVRDDLVEHIDVAALSLAAAGIPIPASMQARDILASDYQPREVVFAARDRCGETTDRIRSVRNDRFLYIRNYHPQRPLLQPSQYKDSKLILQQLRELRAAGALSDLAQELLFAPSRPAEELYDYLADPWQIRNLADSDQHAATLADLRERMDQWITESRDLGSESPEIYDLEIADELNVINPKSPRYETFRENAQLMKRWAAEGK